MEKDKSIEKMLTITNGAHMNSTSSLLMLIPKVLVNLLTAVFQLRPVDMVWLTNLMVDIHQ